MSIAIILPARLASTRLPNKLLLDRTGKTVLEHTIERAKEARAAYPGLFTAIRVACDDERLIVAAKRAGVDAVLTRPDHQSGTDRIAEAAQGLREEIIVNLQADEPEIAPGYIYAVARPFTHTDKEFPGIGKIGMFTLATYIFDEATLHKPNVVKVVLNRQGQALYFSRAPIPYPRDGCQNSPIKWKGETPVYGYHHIGIYAYRRDFLMAFVRLGQSVNEQIEKLEQLRALDNGYSIGVSLVDKHVPGIDTLADYEAFVARRAAGRSPGVQKGKS
jgi:3-deoxy-manno-octulosonate cytidylyltransferase (CMP-KDO synthetase)